MHVERITLDEYIIVRSIFIANKFWRICVGPEWMGKVYTVQRHSDAAAQSVAMTPIEKDRGRWCYCKEYKGGSMIGCDNKSCKIVSFHVECFGMTLSNTLIGKWLSF